MSARTAAAHVRLLTRRVGFPDKAVKAFDHIEDRLLKNAAFSRELEDAVQAFMYPSAHDIDAALKMVRKTALRFCVPVYTMNMVFLMHCSEILLARYREHGIDEEIYWATMDDLRCKLLECYACHGIPGSFVPDWFSGHFELNRFALGRFQYELTAYSGEDRMLRCGYVLHKGDRMYGFHIPSSGIPLTDAVRMDSYKKAYAFFRENAVDGKLVFTCDSWLLFPYNNQILPPHLNVLRFMQDFELIDYSVRTGFSNAWRVYGKYSALPCFFWPADTTQRRAFKEWRMAGGQMGNGKGVFVFDGEKILK